MDLWVQKHSSGFEEYYHPFFDLKSLYIPERTAAVFFPFEKNKSQTLKPQYLEDTCAFCMGRIKEATPEKNRTSRTKENTLKSRALCRLEVYPEEHILFRRQANLFEIVSFEYWQHTYKIDSSPRELELIEQDLSDPALKKFLINLLKIKHNRLNKNIDYSKKEHIIKECKPFYSGYHELLTSGSHFSHSHDDGHLFSSSSMSYEDHRISYHMITDAMTDMITRNKYIRFITIFQNWMLAAGASFNHWHKQILALDFCGQPLKREQELFQSNSRIYEEFAVNTALTHDLIIAENKHAVAYIEVGSKSGFITICSKSHHLRPFEHSEEEINAMSDLSHAMVSCIGDSTPYNEEWYYTPINNNHFITPWRILFNLRSSVNAGFENITQYTICSISAQDLAQKMRDLLIEKISTGSVADNITIRPKNISLSYYKNK
ncbi:MAG: DUF4921 family protein [Brevinema sp.]